MALENVVVITEFIDRSTVWILAFVYDVDGSLVDPTAVKVSIDDPEGDNQVDEASMTQFDSNTGIYEYFYHKDTSADPMMAGEWPIRVDVIDGTGASAIISSFDHSFSVKE